MKPLVRPSVGQLLFRLNIGNNARRREQELTPVTVSSVGRKYFTVAGGEYGLETKHCIDGWLEECGGYSPGYALYESEQAWADEKEQDALTIKIRKALDYGCKQLPLETLKAIEGMIWPNTSVCGSPLGASTQDSFVGGTMEDK